MQSMMTGRKFHDRSPRFPSQPEKVVPFVRYAFSAAGESWGAQFADISITGMRLISRQPARVLAGDIVEIDCTIPGTDLRLRTKACVVRKTDEFIFAVRFLGMNESQRRALAEALARHRIYANKAVARLSASRVRRRLHDYSQGIFIFAAGLIVLGAVTAWICLHSDEHLGRSLRSWGKNYPKQWSLDYVSRK